MHIAFIIYACQIAIAFVGILAAEHFHGHTNGNGATWASVWALSASNVMLSLRYVRGPAAAPEPSVSLRLSANARSPVPLALTLPACPAAPDATTLAAEPSSPTWTVVQSCTETIQRVLSAANAGLSTTFRSAVGGPPYAWVNVGVGAGFLALCVVASKRVKRRTAVSRARCHSQTRKPESLHFAQAKPADSNSLRAEAEAEAPRPFDGLFFDADPPRSLGTGFAQLAEHILQGHLQDHPDFTYLLDSPRAACANLARSSDPTYYRSGTHNGPGHSDPLL